MVSEGSTLRKLVLEAKSSIVSHYAIIYGLLNTIVATVCACAGDCKQTKGDQNVPCRCGFIACWGRIPLRDLTL